MIPQEAVEYLAQQAEVQANREGPQLSQPEKRMLRWSEVIPGMEASIELNDAFEAACDTDEYEERIAGLLKRAKPASGTPEAKRWDDAVAALRDQDAYILVMLGPAASSASRSLKDQLALLFWGTLAGGVVATLAVLSAVYEDAIHQFMQRYAWTDRQRIAITVGAFAVVLAVGWIWRAWWSRQVERLFGEREQ